MTSRSIFVALLLLTACRRETVVPAEPQKTTETVTTTSAAPPEDLRAEKIDTTITIPPAPVSNCQVKASFKPSEPIDFTMQLTEAPAELYVSVRVFKGKEEVGFVRAPAEGKQSVTLRIPKLAPGKYKLEGLWGGNLACEKEIEVVK
jgi:hypothetical protein